VDVTDVTRTDARKFAFIVDTPGGKHLFALKTEEEAVQWLDDIYVHSLTAKENATDVFDAVS
jgi:hypothetical protein